MDAIVPGRVGGLSLDRSEVSPTIVIVVVVIVRRPMMAVARLLQAACRKQVVAPCAPWGVDVGVVGGGRMAPVEWGRGKAMRASLPHNQYVTTTRRRRRNDNVRQRLCTHLSHPICDNEEEEEERQCEMTTVYSPVALISLPPLPAPARDVLATLRHRPAT